MPTNFKDYYQILQVHFDASPDVIKAAYRKLCTLYHPDTLNDHYASQRIQDINEAYAVLGNSEKRSLYHKEWLTKYTNRNQHVYTVASYPPGTSFDASKNILDRFFHALLSKNWEEAYACLTPEDQERNSLSQFIAWRKAVSDCYELQDYRIQPYRSYDRCRIGGYIYEKVTEYAVIITDLDLQTMKTSQSTTHKYTAFDGYSWKTCLGLRSFKQATLRFKLLAEKRKNFNPLDLYNSAVSQIDPLTGLLSETGFYNDALKEIERYKRHGNPLSVVAFQIRCRDTSKELYCLSQCASIIKASSRITDLVARFGNNRIVCLLTETTEAQALAAAQKFINSIQSRQTEEFELSTGILQYNGSCALEKTVFAACSDASRNGNSIWINQEESFK